MTLLNKKFKKYCETSTSKILYEQNNIYKVKNFFKDPIAAKKFILSLNKWECEDADRNTKPGQEIILPPWTGDYLTKKIFSFNNINPVPKIDCIVNIFYYKMRKKQNLFQSSNGTFDLPHHDHKSRENGIDRFVLLVNLNEFEIKTNFWEFNKKKLMDNDEYNNFSWKFQLSNENKNFRLLEMPQELNLYYQAKYNFNEAIIYNASLLHNANIIKFYTKKNPRVTLRFIFDLEIKNKLINLIYQ